MCTNLLILFLTGHHCCKFCSRYKYTHTCTCMLQTIIKYGSCHDLDFWLYLSQVQCNQGTSLILRLQFISWLKTLYIYETIPIISLKFRATKKVSSRTPSVTTVHIVKLDIPFFIVPNWTQLCTSYKSIPVYIHSSKFWDFFPFFFWPDQVITSRKVGNIKLSQYLSTENLLFTA